MKAVVFDRIGAPTDVLRLDEVPMPAAKGDTPAERSHGRVLVKMLAASINPGDFLFIQNLYPEPKKPAFPRQIAGNHGVGVVVEAAPTSALRPGTRVAFSYLDVWAEYVMLPEEWAIVVPDDLALVKASQMVNLVTAWDMLEATGAREGDWVAVTAGHSTVSTMLAQMARARGVEVLSLVRRRLPGFDLASFGSSAVLEVGSERPREAEGGGTNPTTLEGHIADVTGGRGLRGVVDCVGGPVLGDLIRSLAFGGKAIIYGGFRPERFALHNFDLLMKGTSVETYVYRYFFDPPKADDHEMLDRLIATSRPESFRVPQGEEHPLEDFARAVAESWSRPESGKRFLRMG